MGIRVDIQQNECYSRRCTGGAVRLDYVGQGWPQSVVDLT